MEKKVLLKKPNVNKDDTIINLYSLETNGVDFCCPSGQSGNCTC